MILGTLHDAAAELDLNFPLWFGARGSAMIGGVLSTNAGGSNVLRYGSTRALCLGIEVVLADGRVTGPDEPVAQGQFRLRPEGPVHRRRRHAGHHHRRRDEAGARDRAPMRPRRWPCAACPTALSLLNRLQEATGGLVEAFEFMPRTYHGAARRGAPRSRASPFERIHDVTILVELGATRPRDAQAGRRRQACR